MRVVVQRVQRARVLVEGETVGAIGKGYLLLVGVGDTDESDVVKPLARKILNMRLFPGGTGGSHFHTTLADESGEILVVSQFTLHADCRKGRRPSFTRAARPEKAEPLVQAFAEALAESGLKVQTGVFGADMQVELVNDGPVTIILDSDEILAPRSA